jgi:signal transduction histidine kinase
MADKDEFLAIVSHELRTPMTVVSGVNEMVRDLYPDLEDLIGRSDRSILRLRGLVSDILAVTQSDNAQLEPNLVTFDVSQQIARALSEIGDADVEVFAEPGIEITADPAHFEHVIGNLIGNARKYGRPPIRITVRSEHDRVGVEVADEGDGVDADAVATLFDRFSQGDSGSTRRSQGVGLGLHIVKTMVELSNGVIRYVPGESGARFEVSYPRRPAEPAKLEPATGAGSRPLEHDRLPT